MKKLLAWLLLALLSVGLSATALAAVGSETQKSDASIPATFNFYQSYITSDNATPNTFPAETLHFTVVRAASNPDDTMITIADQTVDANPDEIVINVPAYTKVGHYIYTVTETAGSTQGVAYSAASFDVEVLVDFENQSDDRQTLRRLVVFKTHKKDASGKKVDTVTNDRVHHPGQQRYGDDRYAGGQGRIEEGCRVRLYQHVSGTIGGWP